MAYVVPHPSVFIRDEMAARGWTRDILAWCMVLGTGQREEALSRLAAQDYAVIGKAWQMTRLALDFYLEIGVDEPGMRLGDMAGQFSRAFGTSEALFQNLETQWLMGQ